MKTKPHIFIINLEKDVKRRAHMEELCQTYSLSCQFIKALSGQDLSENYIKTIYSKEKAIEHIGRELGHGEIGCALSHISIYQKIVDEALPYAVVLEDDIDTLQDLQIIIDSHQNLPVDWELLLLGEYCDHISLDAQLSSYWRWKSIKNGWKAVRLVRHSAGAHAYIISNRGAKKLLEQLDTIALPIDHYTNDEQYINVYALRPRIIMPDPQYSLQSNLEDERVSIASKTNKSVLQEKLHIQVLKKLGLEKMLQRLYTYFKIPKKYTIR